MGGEFLPLGFGLDGAVHALAVMSPFVYAGGSFSRAFTPRRSALQSGSFAKWDTRSREWLPALMCKPSSSSPFSGTVNALVIHAGKVLVGGRFGEFPAVFISFPVSDLSCRPDMRCCCRQCRSGICRWNFLEYWVRSQWRLHSCHGQHRLRNVNFTFTYLHWHFSPL